MTTTDPLTPDARFVPACPLCRGPQAIYRDEDGPVLLCPDCTRFTPTPTDEDDREE